MFFLFILTIVIILLSVSIYAIHTSRIGIEVENLIIDTEQKKGNKVNKESNIYVYLLIFGKVKLFKKNIKQMKTPNLSIKKQDIDIKILKDIELLRNIDVDIEKIDLYIKIGTQDALTTAILVGVISTFLGLLIRKPKYEVMPVYTNKNLLKIKLNGIFSVYLMQYIYILILKKWKQKIPGKIGSKIERWSV